MFCNFTHQFKCIIQLWLAFIPSGWKLSLFLCVICCWQMSYPRTIGLVCFIWSEKRWVIFKTKVFKWFQKKAQEKSSFNYQKSVIKLLSLVYCIMQKSFLLFLNCRTSYINIALDIGLIDEVNDEVQELEKKLNVYVNLVFSDKERPQSTAQTLSPSTMKGD